MKKTLLQIVQDILSDIDSEEINSLSDSVEAAQIATIVENTFYDLIAHREVPEHQELIKLTALSDADTPTHFQYPTNVHKIFMVWYDKSSDSTFDYGEVCWLEPQEFLRRTDNASSSYDSVVDKNAGTRLRIRNDKAPDFYTSFDDDYIVMDSYDSGVEATLQESKVRSIGVKYPTFDRNSDSYVPDIDASFFPHLISEARARSMDFFKGGVTQKAEQAARRAKVHLQNDKHKTVRSNERNMYGR